MILPSLIHGVRRLEHRIREWVEAQPDARERVTYTSRASRGVAPAVPPSAPPAWWPINEPWPPQGREYRWHARRERFVRRSRRFTFWPIFAFWWLIVLAARWLGGLGSSSLTGLVLPLLAFAAVMAIGAVVLRRVAHPVADLVVAADRVASRDFDVRVPEQGPRTVKAVAHAFNVMAERLAEQEGARQRMMADIAHELRTPLAVLQGRIEGVLDGVYPRDDATLAQLLGDTRHLGRLVDDLRTLASAESGTLALSREPTELVTLARDCVDGMRTEADAKGVQLDLSADASLPLLDVDPIRLREVLLNLLGNAVRHTPAGGRVGLHVDAASDASALAGVTLRVVDTGVGIPAEDLPRIFDRFHKGAGSDGSGLGLTIARRLVVAHGGTIAATSEPGRGTTLTVTLPPSVRDSSIHDV